MDRGCRRDSWKKRSDSGYDGRASGAACDGVGNVGEEKEKFHYELGEIKSLGKPHLHLDLLWRWLTDWTVSVMVESLECGRRRAKIPWASLQSLSLAMVAFLRRGKAFGMYGELASTNQRAKNVVR